MLPGPTCFQPVRSLPLKRCFQFPFCARAAKRNAAERSTSTALNFRMTVDSFRSRSKHVAKHEPKICRAFCEPPDEPRIPIIAVGHQHHRAATLAGKALLLGALDAVEHLNLQG